MGVDFYMRGALEPIRTAEGYQATQQNLSAMMARNVDWFQVTDTEGHLVLLHASHLTHVAQNDEVEA